MAQAKYTIHVPHQDELGQPIRVHEAVHKHLANLGLTSPTIHAGHPTHAVTGYGEDTPETDSHCKQIGTLAAEIANVPHMYVSKEGKNVASWPMRNPHYRPGEGAEQSALLL